MVQAPPATTVTVAVEVVTLPLSDAVDGDTAQFGGVVGVGGTDVNTTALPEPPPVAEIEILVPPATFWLLGAVNVIVWLPLATKNVCVAL